MKSHTGVLKIKQADTASGEDALKAIDPHALSSSSIMGVPPIDHHDNKRGILVEIR